MPNMYGAPEIRVQEVAQKMKTEQNFILLDVREPWELDLARLPDARSEHAPLSRLIAQGPSALPESLQDKEAEIVVVCHHGVRSAQVTAWLLNQGWKNVYSMAGGVEDFALQIDPTIGRY